MEDQQTFLGKLIFIFIFIAAWFHSPTALGGCSEEVARLQERENLLKNQLQEQERLLLALQQQAQHENKHTGVLEQDQEVLHAGCSQLFTSGYTSSGLYRVRPQGSPSPVTVYCDMSDGGGWTVVQRRTSGAESFTRSWAEYKSGFGNMDSHVGEFWLGNDVLHYITAQANYSLRINMEDFDGNQRYAEYMNVKVADEQDDYRLTFGAYRGTAGDALSGTYQVGVSDWASHQGVKFSTFDRDNDNYKGNCAMEDKGGWWFNKCHSAHLNGRYYPGGHYSAVTDDGVVWYPWRGWWYSLKTTVMKLRPVDFHTDPIDDPNAVHRTPLS